MNNIKRLMKLYNKKAHGNLSKSDQVLYENLLKRENLTEKDLIRISNSKIHKGIWRDDETITFFKNTWKKILQILNK